MPDRVIQMFMAMTYPSAAKFILVVIMQLVSVIVVVLRAINAHGSIIIIIIIIIIIDMLAWIIYIPLHCIAFLN